MRKITDTEELKSIRGGVKVQKRSKDIDNWIAELSLALADYMGYVRTSGVYRIVEQPYTIKTLSFSQNESEDKRYFVLDDVVGMYSDENEDAYHLHVETEINQSVNVDNLQVASMSVYLDSTKLKNEIKLLKQNGFKVALYTNENDTKCLVATKGGQIRYNLEKDFIKLDIKGLKSAKDFASNVDASKEDTLENLKKTISSKPDPNTDTVLLNPNISNNRND